MYPVAVPEDFTPQVKLIAGDALTELRRLPYNSVDCCVTWPSFYLQDDHNNDRQIGREESRGEYIRRLVQVFTEVRRAVDATARSGSTSGMPSGMVMLV